MDTKKAIIEELSKNHSHQNEFKNAVIEILDDVIKYNTEWSQGDIYKYFSRLIEPDRLIRFKVEWFDDSDNLCINRGYRVQFNNTLGPYKGGLRFHPTVNEDILKFLGFEQIFKNALTDISAGGAKGGSDFNPKEKSLSEIRRFCQSFMEELYRHIGSDIDIPASDIGVGVREIGFLFGHYVKLTNSYAGILTGKHPNFGGSCGRTEATGHGCVYFLKLALETHNKKIANTTAIVSGSGNVALHAVEKLIEESVNVKTVSDSNGTLFFKDGITLSDLEELKELKIIKRGSLRDWRSKCTEYCENTKPWVFDAQIALPCATENEVSRTDAQTMIDNGLEVLCEGANMPLNTEATEILFSNNILYLPGKAANAGGVAISGLERSQNQTNWSLSYNEVDSKLQTIMKNIHDNCISNVEKIKGIIPYKPGANIYAFNKVADTLALLKGH